MINDLQKELEKSHKIIDTLITKLNEEDRNLFYKHLLNVIDLNIEIEHEVGR